MFRVTIVGRPNVGKSTLFNRIIEKKKAIVYQTPGTTRDRNDYEVFWKDKSFIITDTAGWSSNIFTFSKEMSSQLNIAIEKSNMLLFVVDGKVGVHSVDFKVAQQARVSKRKTILVVNKIDSQAEEIKGYEFYELGFDNIVFISANHGRGINDLLDQICNNIKYNRKTKKAKEILKIVLVGKPNVGKSSFVNAVAKEERIIVHNTPGTTRDSINTCVKVNDKEYLVIDTAGLHRGSKIDNDIMYLSTLSVGYAIDDGDVAILIVDALEGIGETEIKIARLLLKKNKPIIFAINKWDLVEKREDAAKYFKNQIKERIKFMNWANIIFISAKTGQRLERVFLEAECVFRQYSKELSQEEFNKSIRNIITKKSYTSKGKILKIKEYAQVASKPPVFVFSVNDVKLVHFSYKRFVENCLRVEFGFQGTPLVLKFRKYYKRKIE
ncbi:MAG: ribosome biogenesis GTPase Der [Endomicrobium sp.]|jgi:GTP-binding protein|nr:ribosome biogenesis GTPase Der [Endomicrobium sp.]